ncbi:hypothetical protein Bca4012_007979 [Brassica carinata]
MTSFPEDLLSSPFSLTKVRCLEDELSRNPSSSLAVCESSSNLHRVRLRCSGGVGSCGPWISGFFRSSPSSSGVYIGSAFGLVQGWLLACLVAEPCGGACWGCGLLLCRVHLGVLFIPEEVCPSDPVALYGLWVKGMYTVSVRWVGGSNLQQTSPNEGIVGCGLLLVLPVSCVFQGLRAPFSPVCLWQLRPLSALASPRVIVVVRCSV